MRVETILKILNEEEYEIYGLRYDDNNYNVGDCCENSHDWFQDLWNIPDYENLSDEEIDNIYNDYLGCYDGGELDGVSTIQVTANISKALKRMNMYKNCGKDLILVAGNSAREGNDADEIIIRDAIVIAKL